MVEKWKRQQRRRQGVRRRASEPSSMFKNCRVIGCKNLARAATQDGLDTRFCRAHADHYARHGSPYVRSYTAVEINPYRRAAVEWLLANETGGQVRNAIQRVEGLYQRAGAHVEAFRLRGLSPNDRAKKAWARLRHHRIDPRIVVAIWLAVEMITRDNPQAETRREFKQVQAAKIVHRLASGSHKRWTSGPSGGTEMHTYPTSRGQVLRHIGADLESAVELLAEHGLSDLLRFKQGGDGKLRHWGLRPYSTGLRSRPRSKGLEL